MFQGQVISGIIATPPMRRGNTSRQGTTSRAPISCISRFTSTILPFGPNISALVSLPVTPVRCQCTIWRGRCEEKERRSMGVGRRVTININATAGEGAFTMQQRITGLY